MNSFCSSDKPAGPPPPNATSNQRLFRLCDPTHSLSEGKQKQRECPVFTLRYESLQTHVQAKGGNQVPRSTVKS